jgi:hypothetical protein
MSKQSRRPNRRHRPPRSERLRPGLPWQVMLIGQQVGQYCTAPDCDHRHDELPPGVEPFADFGYTVGLHDVFGLPELHMPAYPDGAGKPMKPDLLGATLNVLAATLIRGEQEPGDEIRLALCEHQTVVLSLGLPGPLEAVSAFQCSDGAECIPVRWRVEGSHADWADDGTA